MKTNIKNNILSSAIAIAGVLTLTGCNDAFMDRFPETSITEKVFFKSPGDLEIYTNGMYGYISSTYWDVVSDNCVYTDNSDTYEMLRGEINKVTADRWNFESIRNVNFMLNRTHEVAGDVTEINHYIGLARLFRASLYYSKVKTYSDVPWYSRDLTTTDTELLFKTQDPRALVVDSIMADLQFAVTHMKEGSSKTRYFRSAALALQARIALNEGTFRKYHKELGLNDADRFLTIAKEASQQIMDAKKYSLFNTPQGTMGAYEAMFCSLDLSQNPEIILFTDYDKALGRKNNSQKVFDYYSGLSRDLMEDYLVIKDQKAFPFQQVAGYDTKGFLEVFENRDPRLAQTFMTPGFKSPLTDVAQRPGLSRGGYPQLKFVPRTYDQFGWDNSYTDLPVFRYAEILLINAEAKAELGILTQADLDATINLIRARAGVPNASLTEWESTIDPVQEKRYANVNSSQKAAILEIRRERRIELACEGFRYGDLMRWSCGKLLEKAPEGVYISALGYQDVTADGQPDIAVVATQADADAIPKADKEKYNLTVYILEGNTMELSEGNKGFVQLVAQKNKFKFIEPKYYYYPMHQDDLLDNKNLVQNKYWQD